MQRTKRRRRGCGCGSLLGGLLIIALALGVVYGGDALLSAPWAYGILGRPTLTGDWSGTLTTLSGKRYAIHLQLNRAQSSGGHFLYTRGNADIRGHDWWCARGIPSTSSTVYGFANRSASNVVLETDEPRHPPLGFIPLDFRGAWHGSRLALHVTFTLYNGQGYLSGSIPDEVRGVHFTLHKSGLSTYQRACARIRARA